MPKPKETLSFFIKGELIRYLEEDFRPKIQVREEKVSEMFGSGKASFTAKSPDCYIITQEQNGYALVVDG